jgi:hypothetical protein
MAHELFDTWWEEGVKFPWKAQLLGYVGNFPTQDAASDYVETVKHFRAAGEAPKAPAKKSK